MPIGLMHIWLRSVYIFDCLLICYFLNCWAQNLALSGITSLAQPTCSALATTRIFGFVSSIIGAITGNTFQAPEFTPKSGTRSRDGLSRAGKNYHMMESADMLKAVNIEDKKRELLARGEGNPRGRTKRRENENSVLDDCNKRCDFRHGLGGMVLYPHTRRVPCPSYNACVRCHSGGRNIEPVKDHCDVLCVDDHWLDDYGSPYHLRATTTLR